MRILVTGSNGHVGSAIAADLISKGHDVVGLSRSPSTIKGFKKQLQIDLGDSTSIKGMFLENPPCDIIIHAAAAISKDPYEPSICHVNCFGTQMLLKLAEYWKTKQFFYISGVPVIGQPQHLPITENHPTFPPTTYHASKLFGEHLTSLTLAGKCSYIILRLTSPIGPGTNSNRILPVFIQRALQGKALNMVGKGTRKQNYVDVRDVSSLIESCLLKEISGLYNIAGAKCISNFELAKLCIHILRSASEITFLDEPNPDEGIVWDVSIEKAKKQLCYQSRYGLEQSIIDMSKEYENSDN